jgi:hypothetical protein
MKLKYMNQKLKHLGNHFKIPYKAVKFATFAVLTARDGDKTCRPLQRRYKSHG